MPAAALEQLRARARTLLHRSAPVAATPVEQPVGQPADTSGNPEAPTRRQTQRRQTMIGGKLMFGEMGKVVECFVRDLSESGARIALPMSTQLPPVFLLRLNTGEHHRCRVKRRAGLEIGVQFLD